MMVDDLRGGVPKRSFCDDVICEQPLIGWIFLNFMSESDVEYKCTVHTATAYDRISILFDNKKKAESKNQCKISLALKKICSERAIMIKSSSTYSVSYLVSLYRLQKTKLFEVRW